MTFEAVLLEIEEPPKYQQIAEKALQLNKLELCNEVITRHIGVDGKAVAKAPSWVLHRSQASRSLMQPLLKRLQTAQSIKRLEDR
jgi:hypothetical protein